MEPNTTVPAGYEIVMRKKRVPKFVELKMRCVKIDRPRWEKLQRFAKAVDQSASATFREMIDALPEVGGETASEGKEDA